MPLSNEQKLKYIQVILEECSDSELEQVLIVLRLNKISFILAP